MLNAEIQYIDIPSVLGAGEVNTVPRVGEDSIRTVIQGLRAFQNVTPDTGTSKLHYLALAQRTPLAPSFIPTLDFIRNKGSKVIGRSCKNVFHNRL